MHRSPPGIKAENSSAGTPARQLMELLKAYLESHDVEGVSRDISRHYRVLRLIDSGGAFSVPELEKHAEHLLDEDQDFSAVSRFLDRVGQNIDANPCLRRMLEVIEWRKLPRLMQKVTEEGPAVIPDTVSYAIALQRLTEALRQDHRLLLPLLNHWEGIRKASAMDKHMTVFWRVKRASVKYPLEKMVQIHESGRFPAGFLRILLPLNILEAAAADLIMGNTGNAGAGWTLASNRPLKLTRTRQGQDSTARWSEDGKAFHYHLPLPARWADLYTSWNLAFMTSFRDFPYAFAKLLIPAVSGYRDGPREFLYNRKLALFVYIYYAGFHRSDKAGRGEQVMDWTDPEFSRVWGSVNRESAAGYRSEVSAGQ